MRFNNKVALVTGAGGGLGALYASTLACEGAAIIAVDLNLEGVEKVAESIRTMGGKCLPVKADLTCSIDVDKMILNAIKEFGHIDILINNAGGGSSSPGNAGSLEEETSESWDLLVASNLKSAFLCIRGVIPTMKQQKYGKIVNISSRSARISDPNVHQSPAYATAKTGLFGLTRYAARNLGPYGITVNCIVPSLTISGPVLQAYWDRNPDDKKERFLQTISLGRLPRPEEIASAVLFLCSDESSYITGVALDVNGGSYMP